MRPPPEEPLLDTGLSTGRARALPWATVMGGSLVTIIPVIASVPLLPSFGLLMLLAWRLLAPLALRMWTPALLGLFDDLVSGQPLGSSMLLWQLGFFLIALVDQRTMFRDFWQDWLIAAGVILFVIACGRFLAVPFGAPVDPVLLCQAMIAILTFPLAARFVAWIDRKRGSA